MKLIRRAGKSIIRMSKEEWYCIGFENKWFKTAQNSVFYDGMTFTDKTRGRIKVLKTYPEDGVMEAESEDGQKFMIDMETYEIITIDVEDYKKEKREKKQREEREKLEEIARKERDREERRREKERERIERENETPEDRERRLRQRLEERRTRTWEEESKKVRDITKVDEAFSIGWLAKHGVLNIQIPDVDAKGYDYVGPFLERYRRNAAEDLNTAHNFQISNRYTDEGKVAKYSTEISIWTGGISKDIRDKIMSSLGLTTGAIKDTLYNTEAMWDLIRIGFRPGRNTENISRIREAIPDELKRDFDLGAAM